MYNLKMQVKITAPRIPTPEGFFLTPNISEWRTWGDYFLTTFHVNDIPKYSVILHDCVIILMSRQCYLAHKIVENSAK